MKEKLRLANPQPMETLPEIVHVYVDAEPSVPGVMPRHIWRVPLGDAQLMVRSEGWIVHAWSYTATTKEDTCD